MPACRSATSSAGSELTAPYGRREATGSLQPRRPTPPRRKPFEVCGPTRSRFLPRLTAGGSLTVPDGSMTTFSRRLKESHLDTIQYEIEMLRYCADALVGQPRVDDDRLGYLRLEGFLLHYRNLVRVFSGMGQQHDDDISTAHPESWAGRALTGWELDAIKKPAEDLDTHYHQLISKYLQHCTTLRYEEPYEWDVQRMLAELEPLLAAFESSLGRR